MAIDVLIVRHDDTYSHGSLRIRRMISQQLEREVAKTTLMCRTAHARKKSDIGAPGS
jgi:hypothetical protein